MPLTLNGTTEIVYDNLNSNITTLMQPKNWIINGGFDVWQRGTTQTSDGYGSDDRWFNYHSEYTKTHSQQAFVVGQTEVPNNPTYFSRTIITHTDLPGAGAVKLQRIEDVTKLAGKTVTLSFWAKANTNKNIAIDFNQNFGTGGSVDVGVIGSQLVALTTVWTRKTITVAIPSVSGKTIGAGNYLALNFYLGAGSAYPGASGLGNQSGTFDIANVSLVEGSVPVEWQTEAYADVLRQCQRYYFRIDSIPEQYIGQGNTNSTTSAYGTFIFQTKLRIAPSSIEYSSLALAQIGNALISITSCSIIQSNPNAVLLNFAGVGFPAAYTSISWGIKVSSGGYIAFNAEL